jgi:short chain dehydrogenase
MYGSTEVVAVTADVERVAGAKPMVDGEEFGPWALITGAFSGIGREFAQQVAASNINVALVARREPVLEGVGLWGGGSDFSFRQPMAVAASGGMFGATALSRLVVPVVFIYVDDHEQRSRRLWHRERRTAATDVMLSQ